MMRNFTRTSFGIAIFVGLFLSAHQFARSQRQTTPPTTEQIRYTLTIFVDEGRSELNGHVFISLSDGRNNIYRGFYSKEAREVGGVPIFAVVGLGGGEIRDDSKSSWDVKRTYNISKGGFDAALAGIEATRTEGASWWINNHCGDFAEAVAKAAGVPIELNWTAEGRNRPKVFGEYLRQHGGVVNISFEGEWDVTYEDGKKDIATIHRVAGGYTCQRSKSSTYRLTGTGKTITGEIPYRADQLDSDLPESIARGLLSQLRISLTLTLSQDGKIIQLLTEADGYETEKVGEPPGRFTGRFRVIRKDPEDTYRGTLTRR